MLEILQFNIAYLVLQRLVGAKLDALQFHFLIFRFVSIVIPSSHFSVGWKYPMPSRCTCRPSANSSPIICDSASSTADTSVSVSELRACILWRISSVPTFPLRVMRAWIVFGSV